MERKIQKLTIGVVGFVLCSSSLLAVDAYKDGFSVPTTTSTTTYQNCIPEDLTASQYPKGGVNHWVQNADGKHINCNDRIRYGANLANEAYERYAEFKKNQVFQEKDIIPIMFEGNLEGFVAYRNGQIDIAFRGTKEAWDWATNLDGLMKVDTSLYGFDGAVHTGFQKRFEKIKDQLSVAVSVLSQKHGATPKKINVSGHSLGGATANLASAYLKNLLGDQTDINLTTFNAPRVWNHQAAEAFNKKMGSAEKNLRIWREKDPVPAAALGILGYKHAGEKITLDEVDSAWLINWDKNVVPNHMHKANMRDFQTMTPKFSKPHEGYTTWMSKKWNSFKSIFV